MVFSNDRLALTTEDAQLLDELVRSTYRDKRLRENLARSVTRSELSKEELAAWFGTLLFEVLKEGAQSDKTKLREWAIRVQMAVFAAGLTPYLENLFASPETTLVEPSSTTSTSANTMPERPIDVCAMCWGNRFKGINRIYHPTCRFLIGQAMGRTESLASLLDN